MFHTIKQGTLEYLTADALEGSIHCFSTRLGGVSEGQERKVWALMYRLAAASPSTVAVGDRLRAAIKKEAGVDAFADDPFAWLDYKSCNKLIEALKGYVKNAERKAGAADG